ncbi:B12-binding domain-containing radical SAM protein [Desulfospira joergensenii]|uniref:B12-binding domain-containing radical SAM protein n=1 Tax=Desulfospira joergensenii TaxID=53329 RepID=UPI0003B60B97|nr:radical SAM protein [Desulfospira joergensenii]
MKISIFTVGYKSDEIWKHQFPLGVGYLSAHLKKVFQDEVDIRMMAKEEEIYEHHPDLLMLSSTTQVIDIAERIAQKVKEKLSIPVILGGTHISAAPQTLMDSVDIGVMCEGEFIAENLVRIYMNDGEYRHDNLTGVKGICYHHINQILVNEKQPYIKDIDALSFPDRNIGKKARNVYLYTSRGCPYKCIFCASQNMWGNVRFHSAERVISEIEFLVDEYQAQSILILDDLFFANKKRFYAIAEAVVNRKINEKIKFEAFIRSNLVSEELIKKAKGMGINTLKFGAETGSDSLLKKLKGDLISVKDHQKLIDLCSKYHIECYAPFIFGTPGETKADILMTRDFILKNKGQLTVHGFYHMTPYPGTSLWQYAQEQMLLPDKIDWKDMTMDFLNDKFDWDKIIYLNEKCIPLYEFKEMIDQLKIDLEFRSKE